MSSLSWKSQWGELTTTGLQKHYTLSSYMFSKDGIVLPDFGNININFTENNYKSKYPIKLNLQENLEKTKFNYTESEILINNLLFGVLYHDIIIDTLKIKYGIS